MPRILPDLLTTPDAIVCFCFPVTLAIHRQYKIVAIHYYSVHFAHYNDFVFTGLLFLRNCIDRENLELILCPLYLYLVGNRR